MRCGNLSRKYSHDKKKIQRDDRQILSEAFKNYKNFYTNVNVYIRFQFQSKHYLLIIL